MDGLGVFKMAMYIQPFALAALCIAAYSVVLEHIAPRLGTLRRYRDFIWVAPMLALALCGVASQQYYVDRSRDPKGSQTWRLLKSPMHQPTIW